MLTLNQNPAAAKEHYERALAAAPSARRSREKLHEIAALVAHADSLLTKPNAATTSTKNPAKQLPAAKQLSSLPPTPRQNAAAPAKSPFLQVSYETPAHAKNVGKPKPTATSGSAAAVDDSGHLVFVKSNSDVLFGHINTVLSDESAEARSMEPPMTDAKQEDVSRRIAIPPALLAELATDPVRKAIPVLKAARQPTAPQPTAPQPVHAKSATPTTSQTKPKWNRLDTGFGTWLSAPTTESERRN